MHNYISQFRKTTFTHCSCL